MSDIENSTRLASKIGDRFPAVLVEHHTVLRQIIEREGGSVGSNAGDSVFAVFPTVLQAIAAAVAIQLALRDHMSPDGVELRVRYSFSIGAAVPLQLLVQQMGLVAAGVAIVLVSRAVTVYGLLNLLRPLGSTTSWRWQHLLVWGGLRGAVAVALVLSLDADLPSADAIRALVYGVVLSSIVVQGGTIVPLTRILISRGRPVGAN